LNSVNNGGKLLLNPKLFIVPISRHIAAGWLIQHMWHSLHNRHTECKFGPIRAVTKDTLILRTKQFYVTISPRIAAAWLKNHMWHSLPMVRNNWTSVQIEN
jgi:hypothetical protein